MDIFKLIHKIRNLSIDDKINLAKKLGILFIAIVVILTILITGFKTVTKIFNSKTSEEIPDYMYSEDTTSSLETEIKKGVEDNQLKFETPSTTQKDEFNLYNCLQFSDIKQKDGIVSFTIKNTSTFTIKNVSVNLYNSSNKLITTLSLPTNTKIKPNEEVVLDGFTSEEVSAKVYSYFKENQFITINLKDKTAITEENAEGSNF